LFEKLDRDDNGRLTVSEFLDYVFDDDSAAGVAIETIDQIKEFLSDEIYHQKIAKLSQTEGLKKLNMGL
jgi:hypothetical protein